MRKIIAVEFISLDGVTQAPGGPNEDTSGGFRFGGWLAPYGDESLMEALKVTYGPPYDFLLGYLSDYGLLNKILLNTCKKGIIL